MTSYHCSSSSSHYLFDVVPLLDECLTKLQMTIDRDTASQHYALYDMKEILCYAERLLHTYLDEKIQTENQKLTRPIPHGNNHNHNHHNNCDIQQAIRTYRLVLAEKQRQMETNRRTIQFLNPQEPVPSLSGEESIVGSLYSSRSATDSLLFRLIVALQLCLVRIDDAHVVITGRRITVEDEHRRNQEQHNMALVMAAMGGGGGCLVGAGVLFLARSSRGRPIGTTRWKEIFPSNPQGWAKALSSGMTMFLAGRLINAQWKKLWMTDTIYKSTCEIDEWTRQWQAVQTNAPPPPSHPHRMRRLEQEEEDEEEETCAELLDDKSRRLIEYAMKHSPKSYFWQSQGEIRFLMLKRFMDVYYASVGTALASSGSVPDSMWKMPLIAGAAASFYSITGTGASIKASHVVNKRSRDLIQHAWGMVSLPAIKTLMLHSSRLLKGASVADRLDISGVPCFVLSRNPVPELAATLKRRRNRTGSHHPPQHWSRMSTISETASDNPSHDFDISERSFAGSCGRYRQRDVIFHLTGGGFFAHTIASDLPYLLDWSAATGAVVICPEYALLPENAFPVALNQILAVYSALVRGVDLGFEVNRIIVTGESAGGNLAASLCVHLGRQHLETLTHCDETMHSTDRNSSQQTMGSRAPTKMPDGIMLSCAALNLSLEMSHSRIIGTEDPVLPSGLISAISDAYLPEGFSKKDPLASPFYASDAVLTQFPPALLFAGSNDPLLDDSVTFNERLRCCGVESELRAAHNMPHAYWGLGTAGFPEAQQVQQECQEWLKRKFSCGVGKL